MGVHKTWVQAQPESKSAVKRGKSMSGQRQRAERLTEHVHNLRGGSQPILARASDGALYVVKFADNPQGEQLLFNEAVGNEIFRQMGLSVPEWRPLEVTDTFLDSNPGCWTYTESGVKRPAAGLCYGSRFLGNRSERLYEVLAATSFTRVLNRNSFWLAWLIDVLANHTDNRQVVFRGSLDGTLQAFFVDFGDLFGSAKGGQQSHMQASRYLDRRIYADVSSHYLSTLSKVARCLDADSIWQSSKTLPDGWSTASALEGLRAFLDRVQSRSCVQEALEAMAHSLGQDKVFERNEKGRGVPLSVLCPGVSTSGLGTRGIGERAGHLACA